MSYSLYTYLKENPQTRAQDVMYDWRKLMKDNGVPQSIKSELNELIAIGFMELTDTILWWSDYVTYSHMLYENAIHNIERKLVFGSQFAEKCYTYFQLTKHDVRSIIDRYYFQHIEQCTLIMKLKHWDSAAVEQCIYSIGQESQRSRLRYLLPAHYFHVAILNCVRVDVTDKMMCTYLDYCTEALLQQLLSMSNLQVLQLLNDCDMPPVDAKFNSINDIDRAHEARIEREVAIICNNVKTKYMYESTLKEIAEQYGFTLPDSPIALVKRGKQHNNCVGTYRQQQVSTGSNCKIKRLFFTPLATLELQCEYVYGIIVSTDVLQYKGKFNKEQAQSEELAKFRVALTGQPVGILTVQEVEV